MLSPIEISAIINVILATIAMVLGAFFVYRLWFDIHSSTDIGSVGFFLIFLVLMLFALWDAAIDTVLAWNKGDTTYVLPLTLLKPLIYGLEVLAFLLLHLHFRKTR